MTALDRGPAGSHTLSRPPKLVPAVVEALVRRIVSGEFATGAALPKEAAIISQYGVSRTVIREALRVLEEKGLITIHQGRPTTVRRREDWNLLDPLVIGALVEQDRDLGLVEHLVLVRAALEADMAAAVARAGAGGLVGAMDELLAQMAGQLEDQATFLSTDLDFHAVIMEGSGNVFARHIVAEIHRWTRGAVPASFEVAQLEGSHAQHRAIRDAVAAGRAEEARELMYDHIIGSWRRKVERTRQG